jgi:hypothetical protein
LARITSRYGDVYFRAIDSSFILDASVNAIPNGLLLGIDPSPYESNTSLVRTRMPTIIRHRIYELQYLVINDEGEVLGVKITAGHVGDRDPVPELVRTWFGKLFGDRGYISQALFEQLWEQGVQLITKLGKNMKNKLSPLFDKLLLRKRSLIETVNDQLKTISQIEYSRHRSPFNFFVNLMAGLGAYTFREKKPSLNLRLPQALPAVGL